MEKNPKRICIYIRTQITYIYLNHFAVRLKLTQHCKTTILQFFKSGQCGKKKGNRLTDIANKLLVTSEEREEVRGKTGVGD